MAARLQHVVYLDKDTLIPLSRRIFAVAGQPYGRSSLFFEENIRNSDRDTWKLEHWAEYIAGCNFEVPANLDDEKVKDDLILFYNNNEEEFEKSMQQCLDILEESIKVEK